MDLVRPNPGELAVAEDQVEELGLDSFGLRPGRVVEDEEELPVIAFPVQLVHEEHAGVADVEDPARERRQPQHHLSHLGTRKVGESRGLTSGGLGGNSFRASELREAVL